MVDVLAKIISGSRPYKGLRNEDIFEQLKPHDGRWKQGVSIAFFREFRGSLVEIEICFLNQPNMSYTNPTIRALPDGRNTYSIYIIGPTRQLSEGNPNSTTNTRLISFHMTSTNKDLMYNITKHISGEKKLW